MPDRQLDLETIAAHAGIVVPVDDTVATVGPIVPSTTYTGRTIADVHQALGPDGRGFAYGRNANPTVARLESAVAALEGADDAVAFGSGMGAISACLSALGLGPGDEILASNDLYGVTRSLFSQQLSFEIETRYVDALNPDAVDDAASSGRVRAIYVESISNPLLRVVDIAALAEVARRRSVPLIVDNTFATPILLRALELGADIVVHSASKYIAGHGDVTAGLVVASASWTKRIRSARTVAGGVLSPFEAWLTLRGIRTLPIRMERHCANAAELAGRLKELHWVERIYYPGLPHDPQYELARSQFGGRFGGMLAFDVRGGRERTLAFLDALQVITPGTSLGDVESLVLYPPLSSHRQLNEDALRLAGIGPGLVRLSVGLESVRDLLADLERAAAAAELLPAAAGSVRT